MAAFLHHVLLRLVLAQSSPSRRPGSLLTLPLEHDYSCCSNGQLPLLLAWIFHTRLLPSLLSRYYSHFLFLYWQSLDPLSNLHHVSHCY